MAAKLLVNDTMLNEFVFDVIQHADVKDRSKLTEAETRKIRTGKRAKHFVTKSTIDEKLIMLMKLGVQYSLNIHHIKRLFPAQIKKMYKVHKHELTEETITDLLETGLFVLTDRNVSMFQNLMANGCHSENYMLNRDFYKIGHHIAKYNDTPHATSENIKEGLEHVKIINKLFLNFAMALKQVKGVTRIGELDFDILMFLYAKNGSYIEKKEIIMYFRPNFKMTVVSAAIKRLILDAYIEKGSSAYNESYIISSLGINTIMEFHRKNINSTLNF